MAESRADPPQTTQLQAIPDATGSLLLSVEYDATGLEWARVYDNLVLGWVIDTKGAAPTPMIIGSLPAAAPDTGAILSPQWARASADQAVFVPDQWRGSVQGFFSFIASNNGATRKLDASLASAALDNAWQAWQREHPDLVYRGEGG